MDERGYMKRQSKEREHDVEGEAETRVNEAQETGLTARRGDLSLPKGTEDAVGRGVVTRWFRRRVGCEVGEKVRVRPSQRCGVAMRRAEAPIDCAHLAASFAPCVLDDAVQDRGVPCFFLLLFFVEALACCDPLSRCNLRRPS